MASFFSFVLGLYDGIAPYSVHSFDCSMKQGCIVLFLDGDFSLVDKDSRWFGVSVAFGDAILPRLRRDMIFIFLLPVVALYEIVVTIPPHT